MAEQAPKKFIVGEISKTWVFGDDYCLADFICCKFEEMINVNFERGYVLKSFTLSQVAAKSKKEKHDANLGSDQNVLDIFVPRPGQAINNRCERTRRGAAAKRSLRGIIAPHCARLFNEPEYADTEGVAC